MIEPAIKAPRLIPHAKNTFQTARVVARSCTRYMPANAHWTRTSYGPIPSTLQMGDPRKLLWFFERAPQMIPDNMMMLDITYRGRLSTFFAIVYFEDDDENGKVLAAEGVRSRAQKVEGVG
ncbi:Uu.00g098930.m01.CDS01 [Anthostomella pinea]|uniref:Uu.00g098930.m01.CDS01 n=1 Tax=Anthostomella pinea TaxID=933095 RepID=A0AAI8YCS4_9PEZI|nr:Uu.00g098930.m01.CDS01 [Anthostomella pinea]